MSNVGRPRRLRRRTSMDAGRREGAHRSSKALRRCGRSLMAASEGSRLTNSLKGRWAVVELAQMRQSHCAGRGQQPPFGLVQTQTTAKLQMQTLELRHERADADHVATVHVLAEGQGL